MQLHELKWKSDKLNENYCLVHLRGHDKHLDVRLLSHGDYSIYLEPGHTLKPHSGSSLMYWCNLDPLSAQCILHHLLQEYSDAAS
jgi:hypothetical protein